MLYHYTFTIPNIILKNPMHSIITVEVLEDLKMSWCLRKMAHRKNYELEREKSTRISARHNNICDNYLQCKTLKRKRIKRLKENLKPYRGL